ncbi:MAG: glycosyltransferase [Campylobacteraceae bacterium]|jgi:glycosyltransferase|nr:glycosyltransferase [Campylobacteraceae bacterium]
MDKNFKISIITVVYNGEKYVEDALKSVVNQSYKNLEYIIIDGKSIDNTLNIIKKYEDKISKIISEKDNGLYDAMNKGVQLATGDIVGILNSDDFYIDNMTLNKIAQIFEENRQIDIVYSDLMYVDEVDTDKVVRFWKSGKQQSFKNGWHPPHPTMFVKKELYDKYGLFDTDFKISADYELMLRFIEKNRANLFYLPETTVKMRVGGVSNKSIKNIVKANIEVLKAWKKNGFRVPFFIFFIKPFKKIKQFFVKNDKAEIRR